MAMKMSTPPRRDLLRRSVLSISTPLRTSMPTSGTPQMAPHDEEQERSGRRSMVVMLRRLSSIPSPAVDTGHLLKEHEIQDHLRICTKLYTENRISSKNAWELHVIEAIKKIATRNQTNLMLVAGSSLDVGSKIYSLRIDDAHNKGIQLASTVGKKDGTRAQAENEEDSNVTVNPSERKRQPRKKVRKMAADKRNVIDKEGKSLFAPIKQVESVVFATKENIDVGAIDNLLTCRLPVDPAGHRFMLLSNEKYWTTKPDELLKYTDQILDIDLPEVSFFDICVPFKHFEIGTWSLEDEEKLAEEGGHLVPPPVLDENGVPIPELDGSIHDIFENNDIPMEDAVSDNEEQEMFQIQLHGGIDPIVDAIPEENRIETDYGYNTLIRNQSGKYIDKIWAGPSHWKVKFNKRSTARYSGSTVQQVVKHVKKRNEPQPIDFSEPFLDVTKTMKKFVVKRMPCTTLPEKITLPMPDLWIDKFLKKTNYFCLKPNTPLPKLNTVEKNHDYEEVQAYNYENPNDSLYCSQQNIDDANDEPGHSFGEDMPPVEQQQFLDGNLVDAPEIVTVNQITYAMHAKKVDMKKLKTVIWKHLTGGQGTVQPTKFSNVYEQIPRLAPELCKDLSPHLGILSLLHLCNDHNLYLKATDDCHDFVIMDGRN
ncbi:condensin complex subunit 2 [Tribolium madens]|uniref:condensin complex subunit 2 n=1 Tax=Tribolium madens TaxID=41895 RepID=UPI001CF71E11|nr:condensin complex subunit 2 [Tribolium madens]